MTDLLTAIGTVGATIAAVLGLYLNQKGAKRDRDAAERRLEEERERAAVEIKRRFLQETLNQVTEAYADHQTYGENHEQGQIALRKLHVYLYALPDDMATLVRHELGIALTRTSEQRLLDIGKEYGWRLNPDAVRKGHVEPASHWAYEELAANQRRISLSGPDQVRGERRLNRYRPENPL